MTTTLLIVDDHKIVRDGLRSLLEQRPRDWRVVGEASNGREAVQRAVKLKPDVVVIDVSMPELNGVEATRQIIASLPETKVIALSMYGNRDYVAGMLDAGARGYIRKESAFDEISSAIDAVNRGRVFLGDGVANVVVEDYKKFVADANASDNIPLSGREREVLQLLAEGSKTSEIAEALHVSVKTIETHRRQIMAKLGLYSVAELTKYAIRMGLTSIDD